MRVRGEIWPLRFSVNRRTCRVEYGARTDGKIEMKGEIMDVMNVVAVVGAAAWTPQIIGWMYRFLAKPELSLYLHSQAEIGYNFLGPIFNIRCALLSKTKDVVLNKVSVKLRHETGALYIFDWVGLSEDLSEIENPMAPTISVRKSSLPLAVKVLYTSAAQAFIRFQHGEFRASVKEPFASLLERFNVLKNSGKLVLESDIEGLLSEVEFDRVLKLFDSKFMWCAGEYTVTFEFQSPNKFKYRKEEYIFKLSQDDVDGLRKNIDNMKLDIVQRAKQDVISDYKPKGVAYVWRFPELRTKGDVQLSIH